MNIIENTAGRLVIQAGIPGFNNFTCVFDRASGRVNISRRSFFFPNKPIDLPLTDIVQARVVSTGKRTSTEDDRREYPELVTRDGKSIALPMASVGNNRKMKEAVALMSAFLTQSAPAPV